MIGLVTRYFLIVMPLESRNISQVAYCNYVFDTWYGCQGYFESSRSKLGSSQSLGGIIEVPVIVKGVESNGQAVHNVPTNGSSANGGESSIKSKTEIFNETSKYMLPLLHVCRYCFKYTDSAESLALHQNLHSGSLNPPGVLVYQTEQYCIFKVDGSKNKLYCQFLCLFAKLFLDSKSVYFAVGDFDFYILTENSSDPRVLGFFSKEKVSWDENNLACILIFPPFQKCGLGYLLIAFSYLISRTEGKLGGPEKPLSTYGRKSYTSYWLSTIAEQLVYHEGSLITIDDLSKATSIRHEDICDALKSIDAITKDFEGQKILVDKILNWIVTHQVYSAPSIDEHAYKPESSSSEDDTSDSE